MAHLAVKPQLNWNLDPGAANFVNAVIGFIKATTRDDVQVLALRACQEFGQTIAMSNETRDSIAQTIVPTPKPAMVRFLGTMIGYYKDDATAALGSDVAGLNFLGLACALVTVPAYNAAEALRDMLRSTANDLKLIPSTEYLKQLLNCLEARCSRSGFATKIVDYKRIITNSRLGFRDSGHTLTQCQDTAPTPEGLNILVRIFRELGRIGDASTCGVEIKATTCAAWVAAFTYWCFGVAPSIYYEDIEGVRRPIVENHESNVTIILPFRMDDSVIPLSATIFRSVDDLETLVTPGEGPHYGGMVTIEDYGNWLLCAYGFNDFRMNSLLHEILPHAISRVLASITFSNQSALRTWDVPAASTNQRRGYISDRLEDLCPSPFPNRATIGAMYNRMLGESRNICDMKKFDFALLEELPRFKTELATRESSCSCENCQSSVALSSSHSFEKSCHRFELLHHIATLVADILALSLFAFPDGLRIQMGHRKYQQRPHSFVSDTIEPILRFGMINDCDPSDILAWARAMVGHQQTPRRINQNQPQHVDWILTCDKGQAVFPLVLDSSYYIEKDWYLALNWLPGVLQHDQTTWKAVVGEETTWAPDQPNGIEPQIPVVSPVNFFSNSFVGMVVTASDNGMLKAKLVLNEGNRVSQTSRNPIRSLLGLQHGLIAEHCRHARDERLEKPDKGCAYVAPEAVQRTRLVNNVSVVPVADADDLRFFSIPGAGDHEERPFVLRKDACLACCLDVCRKANISILIM